MESTYTKVTSENSENLWLNIMRKPTGTFAYILRNDPSRNLTILFVLGGVASGVSRLLEQDLIDRPFDYVQLVISITLGAALGWISYYLLAQFLSIAGDLLKGKASVKNYRTVVAWALVPNILSLILMIPQFMFYGAGSSSYLWFTDNSLVNIPLFVLQILTLILNIWGFVILVKGVAFIQHFSIGKALWNILIPFVFFATIILGFLGLAVILKGF